MGGFYGGGTGAPKTAQYVVMAADSTLSAETLFSSLVQSGTLAARPAADTAGRLYLATDTNGGTLYRDTGAAWEQVAHGVNAPTHASLSGVTASQHHPRTEAKNSAGAAASESISFTTAFASTPVMSATALSGAGIDSSCTIESRSTTGAVIKNPAGQGNLVKMAIAQEAT